MHDADEVPGTATNAKRANALQMNAIRAAHQVVRDNLLTLYAAIEHGFATPLPASCATNSRGTSHVARN